ncbi:MAG TPA: sodium-translocating pyrophosphatase [Thermotogota bacterium]|nr:sodium-translocating pyrophosphatase [Thermotogota bacterium]HRW91743.1 sodium-translocating pyrophosphatase [Thermotogota bacterium]
MIGLLVVAVVAALSFAAVNYYGVKRLATGNALMNEIAGAIQEGADAFIRHEYKVIFSIAVFIALALGIVVSWYTGVAFILGAVMSASAGWIGMKIATLANVRVSNAARETKSLGKTLKVAFRGGSVMGLSVGGFALLGLGIVYLVFGKLMGQTAPENLTIVTNWMQINFIPFTMTVSGYALGCSVIAMFDRVGGGIYTKAADMGADLVGKTEAKIPEDDPRNPATIADNVGDNVGDVAGLGADLLESYVGAIISSIVLAAYMFYTKSDLAASMSASLVDKLISYPIFFAATGILSCVLGIMFLIVKKVSDHPHKELNMATWASAILTIVFTGILTYFYFRGEAVEVAKFRLGVMSPWFSAVLGVVSGIVIGLLAEYYTSYDFKPTKDVANASLEGTALTITQGMALGMKSTFFPVAILAVTTIVSNYFAGLYGVAMAAIGMLSFVAATVSVDTYGPIADNAGGISEMSKLDPKVRQITDKLDSVGNTTAAIGKGFAIGSAALAALSLFASYLYSQANPGDTEGFQLVLNMINTMTLAGGLVGAALPFLFSGILIEAVAKAARKMVQEVRRQFKADPKILTGESRPDYKTCIEISSAGALAEMKTPALIAVLTPLVTGFLFGAEFVGGLLIGTTLSGIMLALYTANCGGAWDNGKKYIESDNIKGVGKGSDAHSAAVIGDTVGDPLKDTVGPSLDILIKIMAVISLITVSVFGKYNLLSFFGQ